MELEQDKLTQLHVNTMNVRALHEQLKIIQAEQSANIDRIHRLEQHIATLTADYYQVKQTVMIMKAMGMGHGSTAH